ncbi:MAG: ComEC family competence protein [Flavobacteriales bacterium]|jgi:competence protein ComEC|nr:ComEC family competence protein [Flavobacteriales bacterium]MBK6894125.1 ComEC family competence protein [Flavobacteriales bacterium]QQS73331.1 MAG: ComEC family competence protein [Flavobacteriales bacterium]HQV37977.1 ComEC/Rec2 family competence protein [Flavobacteriales bacterium]HQW32275.1 ComEC/Rec2 family competence protein [Flavobacteriales bacterium]
MHGSGTFTSAIIRAPLLRAVIPFILGLVLGLWLPISFTTGWAAVLLALGLWAFLAFRKQQYGSRWASGVALFVLLLAFGGLWQRLHSAESREDHVGRLAANASGWKVEVTEVASAKERTVRVWAEVRAAFVDGKAVPASGRMLVTLLRDSTRETPKNGDRLLLASRATAIERVPNPGGFDVRQWAAGHGAGHECFAPDDRWSVLGSRPGGLGFFEKARGRISGWLLRSGLPDRERALVKAILLGMRDELEPEQNQAFVRSGTIHVLAVSGTHVGIIYIAVLWGLLFLGKDQRGRLIRGCAALVALWLYAGITGFSPSVLRATVMFSLFTLAEMSRARSESLNSLACAAIVLLLWDPSMLLQLGFQLSFLAVLGIAVFYRPIHLVWAPPNAVASFFWSLIVVSLSAQAFTIPLCLYVFHAFPVWFLPANMAIVGLVGAGVYGGIALLALHAVPVIGPFIATLMKWLLLLLGWLSGFFAGLPGAYPAVRIGFWGMVGLYLLLVFVAAWMLQHSKWARSATLATVAALLFSWGWTAHQRNAQRSFAVYNDRDGTVAVFVQGRTLHVFADGATTWTERSIQDQVRRAGIEQEVRVDSLPRYVSQGGSRYDFLPVERTVEELDRTAAPRTVVMHGKGWLDLAVLPDHGSTLWVLSADMSGRQRSMMRRWGEKQGAAVFDIRQAGAYVRP